MSEQKREKTIELAIPWLLPGLKNENDRCVERLVEALQSRPEIQRAHLERENSPADLCLHYDPNRASAETVRAAARQAGFRLLSRYHHRSLDLEGLDCSDCARLIEHRLERLEGVLDVQVNYPKSSVQVEYDTHKTNQREIEKRILQMGYALPLHGWRKAYQANRELVFSLAAGILLVLGWLASHAASLAGLALPAGVGLGFYLAAYVLGGADPLHHAWEALRERRLDTDLLMLAAALGAAVLGAYAEGAFLLFLFSLGHALEERALDRARHAVQALADLAPKTALVRREGGLVEAPVGEVALGEQVLVRPGVRVPVDGEVVAGRSGVNQAPVTGESLPVDKEPGARVYAGSINGEGALEVRAGRLAKDSTLARVMQLVEEAQNQKAPTQQVTERFTRVFVPVVLAVAAALMVIPPLWGVPFRESFLRAMTLLVAASPCALALGTPAAILAGIAQAARNGVLVKGGAHLENLGQLQALAFDKTGTLTRGEPQVTEVQAWEGADENQVLAWAAALERHSAHPLAKAVLAAAQKGNAALPEAEGVEAETGRGLHGEIAGREVWLGNLRLFTDAGWKIPGQAQEAIQRLERLGQSVMLLGTRGKTPQAASPQGGEGKIVGLLGFADLPRPEARQAIEALRRLGLRPLVMLSGDTRPAAAATAAGLGLDDFRAELMPGDKLRALSELAAEYGRVGMVGDGVNDAPALAQASLGIAMGGGATDVALEAADVALMAPDLGRLPYAVSLGRAVKRVVAQNLIVALGTIGILGVAAITGWVGMGVAVVVHEGSTLLVVANALRLLADNGLWYDGQLRPEGRARRP